MIGRTKLNVFTREICMYTWTNKLPIDNFLNNIKRRWTWHELTKPLPVWPSLGTHLGRGDMMATEQLAQTRNEKQRRWNTPVEIWTNITGCNLGLISIWYRRNSNVTKISVLFFIHSIFLTMFSISSLLFLIYDDLVLLPSNILSSRALARRKPWRQCCDYPVKWRAAVMWEFWFFEVKQKGDVGFPIFCSVGRTQSSVYLQPGLQW